MADDLSSITGTPATSELNAGSGRKAFVSEKALYGRTTERLALLDTYQRLLQTKQAQTLIIHGKSGSGKTALVNSLRSQLVRDQSPGFFVSGGYFQNEGEVQEAHSAIMAAFSDLCDLVAQSDRFDQERQKQVEEVLGSDVQLLAKHISNLSAFVGNINKMGDVQEEKASVAKFKIACKTFLRAMATNSHPAIIFLDDVQWADEGSIQLIEMFLQASTLKNVMFILAYRDEEAAKVDSMLTHARDPLEISLSNLSADAVYQLVSSIVGSCSENVRDLSDLVQKRTAGNPFYVNLFMETIEREGLLVFNSTTGTGSFSVDKIQIEVMASESLADLLARKIELLPKNSIEVLKVAALLGHRFQVSIVVEVACRTMDANISHEGNSHSAMPDIALETVLALLDEAIARGFIETTTDGYQFTHNKLRASFKALIGPPEEDKLCLLIGEAILNGSDDNKAKMYRAAVHLNRAPGFLYDHNQTSLLARINLQAAKYCEQKFLFDEAHTMLKKGLKLIAPHERWAQIHFELTFEIMETLARIQLIVGDFEGCKQTTKDALTHASTIEMQMKLLLIAVEVRMTMNEVKGVDGSLHTALGALRMLGLKMPRNITIFQVAAKLIKIRQILKRKAKADLLNLPTTQDCLAAGSVKLLMHVCSDSMVTDDVNTGIYAALLALEVSLDKGFSPNSPSALIFYGIAEVSLGNIDRGYRYGKLALAMLDAMPCKEAECSTIGQALTMLICRKQSYYELMDPLFHAAKNGYERGDVLHASYSLAQSFQMHLYMGTPLATVEKLMRVNYELGLDFKQEAALLWFQPHLQYVTQMRSDRTSEWQTISTMTGEFMVEPDYYRKVREAGNLALSMMCSIVKAEIAISFDQHSLAAEIYDTVRTGNKEAMHASYSAPVYYWNAARAYYMLYEDSGKRCHLRKARRYQKLLQRMETAGCPNAVPLVAFLAAQALARQKSKNVDIVRVGYDTGIICLAEHHFLLYEATLNEKAGFDFASRDMPELAQEYFDRALHIYKFEWGAIAKYNWLVAKSKYSLATTGQNSTELCGTLVTVRPMKKAT